MLKIAWGTTSTTVNEETRYKALSLVSVCYRHKRDLVTNGVVITDGIKFVEQNKQELSDIKITKEDNSIVNNAIETF